MTWNWIANDCSEACAVIDAVNTAKKQAMFSAKRIDEHLA
jgi:hypothetical protein